MDNTHFYSFDLKVKIKLSLCFQLNMPWRRIGGVEA